MWNRECSENAISGDISNSGHQRGAVVVTGALAGSGTHWEWPAASDRPLGAMSSVSPAPPSGDSCSSAPGWSRRPFTQSWGLEHLNLGHQRREPENSGGCGRPSPPAGTPHRPGPGQAAAPGPAQSPPRWSPAPALPPRPRRPPLSSQRAPVSSSVRGCPPL